MSAFDEDDRRKIDPYFRQVLLELTVKYIEKNPPDFLDFALDFFVSKHHERISAVKSFTGSSDEEEEDDGYQNMGRRFSIHGESYDPLKVDLSFLKIHIKSDFQKKKLKTALEKIVFFSSILENDKNDLIDVMERKDVNAGEVVIREGDTGDFFYIVESGIFEAFKTEDGKRELLKTYENDGFFGEVALLYDIPRSSSVEALTNGLLWSIDRSSFRQIVLKSEFNRTKKYEELLENVPLLASLTPDERQTLADCLIPRIYRPGQRLISEGEAADGMYFVITGTVRVTVKDELGKEMDVKSLTAGDYFGELALITHRPRAATVYAVDHVQAAFLEINSFERLLGPCVELMQRNAQLYEIEVLKTMESLQLGS